MSQDPIPAWQKPAEAQRKPSGCGCLIVVLLIVFGLPIGAMTAIWLLLPTLIAPTDGSWQMPPPDADAASEVRESLRAALGDGGDNDTMTVTLDQRQVNLLLADGLRRVRDISVQPADEETAGDTDDQAEDPSGSDADTPRGRILLADSVIILDAVVTVPDNFPWVPARVYGRTAGLSLSLRPRADESHLVFAVDDARIGRIPVPVGLAMSLLRRTPAAREANILDADTGELRVPVAQFGGLTRGTTVQTIEIRDQTMTLLLSPP